MHRYNSSISPFTFVALLLWLINFFPIDAAIIPQREYGGSLSNETRTCQRTTVAILGAGIAGITAAQALSNNSVTDFIILEYKDHIGGRVHSVPFGTGADGKPLLVEYGANWVQGLGKPGKRENPIWTLEKKWNIANHPSNFTRILTYNETGLTDFSDEIEAFENAVGEMEERAGEILENNLQDPTMRAGLSLVGWKPSQRKYPQASEAVEWWLYDGEQAVTPEDSSLVFNAAVSNFTFLQFNDENNFVIDQRGHRAWIEGEASTFLSPNDQRLRLNTIVERVDYSPEGVIVTADDGSCVQAGYAICTFSLGVLQRQDAINFQPELPKWKKTSIEMFEIGVYTKIFLQFPHTFWPADTEFFLYADPHQRGWYPIWQTLDLEGFFPGSHVLFVTLTGELSYRVEKMTNEETLTEVMEVLRSMFPDVEIPQPVAFTYPRWSEIPWAYGSFSVWPAGTTLEMHENLRANVDRLWFTGEHTSASYFGYMQGAWFEGRDAGNRISGLITGTCVGDAAEGECGERVRYGALHGTTTEDEYDIENGWDEEGFRNGTFGEK